MSDDNYEAQERLAVLNRLNALRDDIRDRQAQVSAYLQAVAEGRMTDSPPKGFEPIEQLRTTLRQLDVVIGDSIRLVENEAVRVQALEAEMDSIADAMLDVQDRIEALGIQQLTEDANVLANHYDGLVQRTHNLEGFATATEKRLGQFRTLGLVGLLLLGTGLVILFLMTQNGAIEQQMNTLSTQVAQSDAQVAALAVAITTLEVERQNAEASLEALVGVMGQIAEASPQIVITEDPRIAALQTQLNGLETALADVRQIAEATPQIVITEDPRIAELQAEIGAVRTQLDGLTVAVGVLQNPPPTEVIVTPDFVALENRIQALEAGITELRLAQSATAVVPPTEAIPAKQIRLVTIISSTPINFRVAPSADSTDIGNFSQNAPYDILGINFDSQDFIWFCVSLDGVSGWIASVGVARVEVSEDGGLNYTPIGSVTDRTALTALGLPSECPANP